MSDFGDPASNDITPDPADAPLSWPTADQVVPDDQVVAPDPETGEDPVTPEATAPVTPAPEATPPADPATPPATTEPAALESLPQSWQDTIRDLRKENGDYRVQYKQLDEVFGQYNDVERNKFLDLAAGLADESRHQEVAAEFISIGKRILEHYGVDVGELDAPDPNAPMTRAQYEAAERQRQEERDIEANVAKITETVKALGYEPGSLDHYALLRAAQEQEGDGPPDWDAAHAAVTTWKKGMIDAFIQEHAKKAGAHLPTPPQTGQTPADPPDEIPADTNDAFAQARQRFGAMLDAS